MVRNFFAVMVIGLMLTACWASEPLDNSSLDSAQKDIDAQKLARSEPYCGDDICQAHENKCTCITDCGRCEGRIDDASSYQCVENQCVAKKDVECGDGVCHDSEKGSCEADCPSCDDSDKCTLDVFAGGRCTHEIISPCCGDGVCSAGEAATCIDDCGGDFDLSDYPEPFISEGQLNTQIIIGEGSGSKGVVAATAVLAGLDFVGQKPGYTQEGLLDTDISSIQGKNVILIGNPCMNQFVAELYKTGDQDCLSGIAKGEKIIRLFRTGAATYALVISGYDEDDVRAAGVYVQNWDVTQMSGVEVRRS